MRGRGSIISNLKKIQRSEKTSLACPQPRPTAVDCVFFNMEKKTGWWRCRNRQQQLRLCFGRLCNAATISILVTQKKQKKTRVCRTQADSTKTRRLIFGEGWHTAVGAVRLYTPLPGISARSKRHHNRRNIPRRTLTSSRLFSSTLLHIPEAVGCSTHVKSSAVLLRPLTLSGMCCLSSAASSTVFPTTEMMETSSEAAACSISSWLVVWITASMPALCVVWVSQPTHQG